MDGGKVPAVQRGKPVTALKGVHEGVHELEPGTVAPVEEALEKLGGVEEEKEQREEVEDSGHDDG